MQGKRVVGVVGLGLFLLMAGLGLNLYISFSQTASFYNLTNSVLPDVDAKQFKRAKRDAERILRLAESRKSDWNYGNAVHKGNIALGRIALAEGDKKGAGDYLMKAGRSSGSPQMNSFGPNMTLAQELLAAGEKDVVLRYFDECGKFWSDAKLARWKKDVKAGKIPDFGANLKY